MNERTEVRATTVFGDRRDAGRLLAAGLGDLRGSDVVVLGLPRGGVPVAYEVARALAAPLDVIVVRKLGVPFQPEVAMGAIGEGGVRVLDPTLIARASISDAAVRETELREREVLESRVETLRRGRPRVSLQGRIAVVVDDGIATGATARAACEVVRKLGAARIVVATPVAPAGTTAAELSADELVCFTMPLDFRAVGNYYRDFSPTTEHEMLALLAAAPPQVAPQRPVPVGRAVDAEVRIAVDDVVLRGQLDLPAGTEGVVLFAHGSGSSRLSSRNQYVARRLRDAGLGTLLFDLLAPDEESDRRQVFDIPLLGGRLHQVAHWLLAQPEAASCRLGYFGASTGAAAALWAAAEPDSAVRAVVSRGGRPDLAGDRLAWVQSPTLLIVGGADTAVLDLNRQARARMKTVTQLVVVPGATHLFEEPGTLEEVSRLAADWFRRYLLGADGARARRRTLDESAGSLVAGRREPIVGTVIRCAPWPTAGSLLAGRSRTRTSWWLPTSGNSPPTGQRPWTSTRGSRSTWPSRPCGPDSRLIERRARLPRRDLAGSPPDGYSGDDP